MDNEELVRLASYLDEEGRVTRLPGKRHLADFDLILRYLVEKFEYERIYTEREVTDLLRQWHTFEDWALLRRELFERGLINRETDGSRYWRTNTTLY